MHTNLICPWWPRLLAMRLAAGSRICALAQWLATHPEPERAEAEPPWQPSSQHVAHAVQQARVLVWLGLHLVPVWAFPLRLRRIRPLPAALFVRGDPALLRGGGEVAMVGSRQASADARAWAYQTAMALGSSGVTLISGGARGIDSAVHLGAMAGAAPTLAYMGTAIDRPYPGANRDLFAQMVAHGGALVSEHPPLSRSFLSGHAMRNRLIAAHAERVVLVEAGAASGTLGTARWARRWSTPLYVSPAHVGRERAGLDAVVASGWATTWPQPAT